MEDSHWFLPAFWLYKLSGNFLNQTYLLILLIFSCCSDSLKLLTFIVNFKHSASQRTSTKKCYFHFFMLIKCSSLRLPCESLLENFLIEAALLLLTWEFPHSGCLSTTYFRISSLGLPCSCLLENFVIETASRLLTWKFAHWGCLGTGCSSISSLRLLIYQIFILKDTLLRLHDWGGMHLVYLVRLSLLC